MMDNFYNKEDKIILANILDKYKVYQKTGKSVSSNFLNSEKLKLITNFLDYKKIPYFIYQPYPFLEKKIIYFGKYENFVTFYKVDITGINHSQILGTLFSIGFDENLIGDIFVEDGYFYYTNLTRMNSFLENHLVMIKNHLITLHKVDEIILNKNHFETIKVMVSSMRLDNILSKLTSKSRSQANQLILEKKVLLNYHEENNANTILKEGDILSIRKYGKYKISSNIGYTKKNNIILEIIKYV